MKRVVVTGMALKSPLGCDINTACSNLDKYKILFVFGVFFWQDISI